MAEKPEFARLNAPGADAAPNPKPATRHVISLPDAMEVCRTVAKCGIVAFHDGAWLVSHLEYAANQVSFTTVAAVVPDIFLATTLAPVLKLVHLAKLSACKCGYGTLKDSIPLGTRYLVDMSSLGRKAEYKCGGCRQTSEVATINAWSAEYPCAELRPVPATLFDLEAKPCRVN